MQIYTAESLTDDLLTQNIVTPGGRIIASQRYDNDSPVGWYFYNYDIRQSTTTILNEDYGVEKSYKYDEFGNTVESGSLLNEIAYTSAVSDSNTGLYYMNSRYYNPNTSRFISQDSYKGNVYDPWTQHLYSYVGNNPVNMIDPTGHYASFLQPRNQKVKVVTDTGTSRSSRKSGWGSASSSSSGDSSTAKHVSGVGSAVSSIITNTDSTSNVTTFNSDNPYRNTGHKRPEGAMASPVFGCRKNACRTAHNSNSRKHYRGYIIRLGNIIIKNISLYYL